MNPGPCPFLISKNQNQNFNEKKIISKVLKKVEALKQDKFIEYNLSTTVGNGLSIDDISATITEGTSQSQRIGNQVKLKRLRGKMLLGVADTTNFIRFVVFKWIPSTTSDTPVASELFCPNASLYAYASFLPNKPSRFQVLYDRVFSLSAQGPACVAVDIDIKLGGNSSFDVGVNTGRDHIYYMAVSDSAAVAHPTIGMDLLLHFNDTA